MLSTESEAYHRIIESVNNQLRDGFLKVHEFLFMEDERTTLEAWRIDYNKHRPKSLLGHLIPSEHVQQSHRQRWPGSSFSVSEKRTTSIMNPDPGCHRNSHSACTVLTSCNDRLKSQAIADVTGVVLTGFAGPGDPMDLDALCSAMEGVAIHRPKIRTVPRLQADRAQWLSL